MSTEQADVTGWVLDFWDFRRAWAAVDDIVPGLDLIDLAEANGAKQGTATADSRVDDLTLAS